MKKTIQVVVLVPLVALATGCASPYIVDRGRDATDIFTAAVGVGIGAKVRVGPVQPALVWNMDCVGLRSGQIFCLWEATLDFFGPFGLIGSDDLAPAQNFGVEIEANGRFSKNNRGKVIYAYSPFPFVALGSHPAYYSQLEVVVGVGPSIRLGFNPGELLDFILGWTTIDIFNDDLEWKKRKSNQSMERDKQ